MGCNETPERLSLWTGLTWWSTAVLEELARGYRFVRIDQPAMVLTDGEGEAVSGYVEAVLRSMALFEGHTIGVDMPELAQRSFDYLQRFHPNLSDEAARSAANCICYDWM